jgi:hypothetical protein
MSRLRTKRSLVEEIAKDAEGEDCYGKKVAAESGVAVEETGEDFIVVF